MLKRVLHITILLAFCAGMFAFTPAAPAAASPNSKGVSPEEMLNPDGTLSLGGNFRGPLDLDGYNVQLDAARGPVFTPIAAEDNWIEIGPNGGAFTDSINAVAILGTDVYVGGWFRDVGGVQEADYIAKWNGSQWAALSNSGSGQSAISSVVYDMLVVGSDLYVVGGFGVSDTSGNVIPNSFRLAKWNGTAWSAAPGMTENLNATAYALGYDTVNHILYVGGAFTNANGSSVADKVFGMDLDTNSIVTLGSNGLSEGSLNSNVYAFAVDSAGVVYVGGAFTNVSNGLTVLNEADYIAKWDGVNWSAMGNNGVDVGALNMHVNALALDASDNVYVGGTFSNAAGIAAADYIAKWNGSAWSALGSDGAGGGALAFTMGSVGVQAIIIDGSTIYVGGYFVGPASLPTADFVARFNTVSEAWSNLGNNGSGNGALNGGVGGMALNAGTLYVGGSFFDVNNGGSVMSHADYFATWDGANWSTLGETNGGFTGDVEAIAIVGSDVYVGGNFVNFGGDPRMDFIARWDGSAWNPVGNLTQTNGSLNQKVEALLADGADLYVGGQFTQVYNEGSLVTGGNYIAKWDGSTWSALGDGFNNFVYAMALDTSHNLYAGGSFTNAASTNEADYIAKWNGSAWSAMAGNGSGNGALNNIVYALATAGTNVYVGGAFPSVVDPSNSPIANAAYLAKWNGSAWSAMDGISTPLSSHVYALAVTGSDVYAGGNFNNLNGISTADWIAKWDGATWSNLGSNGLGEGSLNAYVTSIAVSNNNVFVGGAFTNVTNADTIIIGKADYVAKWNGLAWAGLGGTSVKNGSLNSPVQTLMIQQNDLWVGGSFQNVDNHGVILKGADRLAAFGMDIAPAVVSINRAEANPSAAGALDFTVTFSESVTGVDVSDFTVTKTGSVSGATVGGLSGSGSSYTVTVNTGNGSGTIRLDLKSTGTGIVDVNANAISGGFTSGQVYTINKTITYKSDGANDGWILESSENSGAGGTMNASATTFNLGDDAAKKQYRAILHFDTSSLPDNATITNVTLKIKKQGLAGTDPFTILGGLTVDMRRPSFGALALALTDFKSAAGRTAVATFGTTPVANWYSAVLSAAGRNYVNKTGTTQFRLRFATDDNNNAVADFMKFFSGNAALGSRPQLIVEYKIP